MGKPETLTPAQIIDAIPGTGGLPLYVGNKLHVTAQTIRNYAKRYKTVAEALEAERRNMGDFTEGKLIEAIKNGEITAIIFYLKTQCKDRGYSERHEVTGADGGPLELAIVERIVDAKAHADG